MRYTDAKLIMALRVVLILAVIALSLAGCGDVEPIDITPFCLGGHANIALAAAIVVAILKRAGVL